MTSLTSLWDLQAMADFKMDNTAGIYMDYYTCPELQGFTGVIKSHSEDFIVTEVDGSGQLVCLTSCQIPPPPVVGVVKELKSRPLLSSVPPLEELVSEETVKLLRSLAEETRTLGQPVIDPVKLGCYEEKEVRGHLHIAVRSKFPVLKTTTEKDAQGGVCVCALGDPKYPRLTEVMTPEDSEGLLTFVNTSPKDETHTLTGDYTRDQRTKIHLRLHETFGALLSTHTLTEQERKRKLSRNQTTPPPGSHISVRFRVKKRATEGSFVTKFVLRKRNIETLAAIELLSGVLDCQPSQFSCAGIKDKKAVTTQHMSVTDVSADRLSAANDHPDVAGCLETGDYAYCHAPIQTGDHSGNHFTIVVRDVTVDDEVVAMAVRGVGERGFVNYFGPQRFGGGTSSARVALAMLRGEHRSAVDLILTSTTSEQGEAAEARDYYVTTGDVAGTLEKMPLYKTRERYVLKALHRHGNSDYGCVCALNSIPYTWRKLYLHGLSSLLWNYLASWRLTEYGLQPVEGDLVMGPTSADKPSVCVLSLDEVDRYTISDVVLPCVGTSSTLPANKVGGRLIEIMTALGVSLASFRMPRLGLNSSGAYRKLMAYPKQFSWRRCERPLPVPGPTAIDCGTSEGKSSGGSELADAGKSSGGSELADGGKSSGGSELADGGKSVELSFSLSKATYATVLLRELMKTST